MERAPKRPRVSDPDLMWMLCDDPNWIIDDNEDTQCFVYIGHEVDDADDTTGASSTVTAESVVGAGVATGAAASVSHDVGHHVSAGGSAGGHGATSHGATPTTVASAGSGHHQLVAGPSAGSSVQLEPEQQ